MPIKFSCQRQELCLFHEELEAGDPGFAHPGLCSFLFGTNIQTCGFHHQGGGKEPTVSCKSLMVPFVLLRNGESRAPAPPLHPPGPPPTPAAPAGHGPELAGPRSPLDVTWQKPLCPGARGQPGAWKSAVTYLKSSGRLSFQGNGWVHLGAAYLEGRCMVWIPGLYQRCLLEIFSPSCGFSSQSLDIVFHGKVFNFNEVRLINSFFHGQ